jgi:hypothetical protein
VFAEVLRAADASGPMPSRATSSIRYDVALQIYDACVKEDASAERFLSSVHGTWFRLLRAAIRQAGEEYVSRQDWISAILLGMLEAKIEWMPGADRKRITSQSLVLLVGMGKSKPAPSPEAGSHRGRGGPTAAHCLLQTAP